MATDLTTSPAATASQAPAAAMNPPGASGTTTRTGDAPSEPVLLREMVAVAASVAAFDLLVYRGHGYAGVAVFFVLACLLAVFGSPHRGHRPGQIILGGMSLVLAARMVWLGYEFLNVLGVLLLVAFAMAAVGRRPYVIDVAIYGLQSIVAGFPALFAYGKSLDRLGPVVPRATWLKVVLPLVAVLGFGTIFVLANPDVATFVGNHLGQFVESMWDGLLRFSPEFGEIVLWIFVAILASGLLRPILRTWVLKPFARPTDFDADEPLFETTLFAAYRNTLVAVIALFAVYLVFEFATLWFRTFPEGFYYAGYAHEGAAWLTVALAATTFVLSAIFREATMRDPRVESLKRLAWGWSALNLLLALAVYNRMFIYVDFNGMTRMRTVGLMGITAVVVGFLLVVWKIRRDRDFAWLIERQLWTLAVAIFVLAVLPVDLLVHSYNVRRILAGDPAPSVQITEHPVDSSGVLVLSPLLNADDPILRDGIRAFFAERSLQLESTLAARHAQGWTSFQLADRLLFDRLQEHRTSWEQFTPPDRRNAAWGRFRDYAYQWY